MRWGTRCGRGKRSVESRGLCRLRKNHGDCLPFPKSDGIIRFSERAPAHAHDNAGKTRAARLTKRMRQARALGRLRFLSRLSRFVRPKAAGRALPRSGPTMSASNDRDCARWRRSAHSNRRRIVAARKCRLLAWLSGLLEEGCVGLFVDEPPARARMALAASSCLAVKAKPLSSRNRTPSRKPVRLFPSTNGWFFTTPAV